MPSAALGTKNIGDIVKLRENTGFQNYIVCHIGKPDVMYDNSYNGGVILLRQETTDFTRQWHTASANDYANSDIDAWLNDAFYNTVLDKTIRDIVMTVKIPYRPGSGTTTTINSGVNGLPRKVFLLSAYEAGSGATASNLVADGATLSYFAGIDATGANAKRDAYSGGSARSWWLRSPNRTGAGYAWIVSIGGGMAGSGVTTTGNRVRPALVLPASVMVSDTGVVTTGAPECPIIMSGDSLTVPSTGGTFQVTAIGDNPIVYGLTDAPAGISINANTGLITIAGTTAPGNHFFTVTASNGVLPNAAQSFSLIVKGLMPLGARNIGDTVKLNESGTLRNYIIAHTGKPSAMYDDSFTDGVILLREDLLPDLRQWHSVAAENDYANSDIDAWLNDTFYNTLDAALRDYVITVKIPYRPGVGPSSTVDSGVNGLPRNVFLLGGREIGAGSNVNPADGATLSFFVGIEAQNANPIRRAYREGTTTYTTWWTRSPYITSASNAWSVPASSNMSLQSLTSNYGIRPALTLPASIMVSEADVILTGIPEPPDPPEPPKPPTPPESEFKSRIEVYHYNDLNEKIGELPFLSATETRSINVFATIKPQRMSARNTALIRA